MQASPLSSQAAVDQQAAAAVEIINQIRHASEAAAQAVQDLAFENAINEIETVYNFIDSPGNILGSPATKHGEIAEVTEVGIKRAESILQGEEPVTTFEGVGRTAPADYLDNGAEIQSKFYNGANNSLGGVLEHMEKYPEFAPDGGSYVIPKDQFEKIERVLKGDFDGLNKKSVDALLGKVREIESATGQPFAEVVKPSELTYAEVQQNQIEQTLGKQEEKLADENDKLKDDIHADHRATFAEGLKATAIAGAVGGAVGFMSAAYAKYRQGKNVFKGEFTAEDWKDVGGSSLSGAAMGAVTGAAVYTLTNCANLSAPFAAAFVSAAKGLQPLIKDYRAGKISFDQLLDAGTFVCADVAIVGLCTAAGQALIPIPGLGAVLGSIAGKCLSELLSGRVKGAAAAIAERTRKALEALDARYRHVADALLEKYRLLGELTQVAFDLKTNQDLLTTSVTLARAHGVAEQIIIKNHDDLDRFMLT